MSWLSFGSIGADSCVLMYVCAYSNRIHTIAGILTFWWKTNTSTIHRQKKYFFIHKIDKKFQDKQNNQASAEFEFSNTRFWRVLRIAFKVSVLILLIGLIAFIVTVIVITPGCKQQPQLSWWDNAVVYRLDIGKLNSSNGMHFKCKLGFSTTTKKQENVHEKKN